MSYLCARNKTKEACCTPSMNSTGQDRHYPDKYHSINANNLYLNNSKLI